MEVGCLEYPGASTIGSQPLDWNNAPMTGTTAQQRNPAVSPHTLIDWLTDSTVQGLTNWLSDLSLGDWLTTVQLKDKRPF